MIVIVTVMACVGWEICLSSSLLLRWISLCMIVEHQCKIVCLKKGFFSLWFWGADTKVFTANALDSWRKKSSACKYHLSCTEDMWHHSSCCLLGRNRNTPTKKTSKQHWPIKCNIDTSARCLKLNVPLVLYLGFICQLCNMKKEVEDITVKPLQTNTVTNERKSFSASHLVDFYWML